MGGPALSRRGVRLRCRFCVSDFPLPPNVPLRSASPAGAERCLTSPRAAGRQGDRRGAASWILRARRPSRGSRPRASQALCRFPSATSGRRSGLRAKPPPRRRFMSSCLTLPLFSRCTPGPGPAALTVSRAEQSVPLALASFGLTGHQGTFPNGDIPLS